MYEPELPSEDVGPATPLQRPTFYIQLARPIVSRIIIGILLVVFVVEVVYGLWRYGAWMTFTGTNICTLIDLGAKVNPLIAAGQTWRLFTATLLHDGILHLLFNLYALFALGPMLEAYVGRVRFIAIYILAGLFGSLASYAFSPAVSVGASGAIFGLIGAITVYFARYHNNFGAQGRAILQNMIVVIVINMIFGVSSGFIDIWGHIGGLIGGAMVAAVLLPRYRTPAVVRLGNQPLDVAERRAFEIAGVVGLTIILIICVYWISANYADPSLNVLADCKALQK